RSLTSLDVGGLLLEMGLRRRSIEASVESKPIPPRMRAAPSFTRAPLEETHRTDPARQRSTNASRSARASRTRGCARGAGVGRWGEGAGLNNLDTHGW